MAALRAEIATKVKANAAKRKALLSQMKSMEKKLSFPAAQNVYLNNITLKNLLLRGIPQSNGFIIDQASAAKFIKNQSTRARKLAARALMDTNLYIPHSQFIATFRKLLDPFFRNIGDEDYIILSENKTKSGFFCTMIFLFLVKEGLSLGKKYKYPVYIYLLNDSNDIKKARRKEIFSSRRSVKNYVFINDADYSSNQLSTWTGNFASINAEFYVLRVFTNTYALEQLLKGIPLGEEEMGEGWIRIRKNVKYMFAKSLLTLKQKIRKLSWVYGSGEPDKIYNDIIKYFAGCDLGDSGSIMNIYFDHKIADFSSTAALALTMGIIPNNNAYKGKYCNFRYDNEENKYHDYQTYEPLISNCSYNHLFDEYTKKYNGNMNLMRTELDDGDQLLRCPYAWYKKINYETGEVELTKTRIIQDVDEENEGGGGAANHGQKTTYTGFGGNRRKKTRKRYLPKKKSRKRRRHRRRRRRHTAKKKKYNKL